MVVLGNPPYSVSSLNASKRNRVYTSNRITIIPEITPP